MMESMSHVLIYCPYAEVTFFKGTHGVGVGGELEVKFYLLDGVLNPCDEKNIIKTAIPLTACVV